MSEKTCKELLNERQNSPLFAPMLTNYTFNLPSILSSFLTAFLFSFLAHPCFCIPCFSSSFFCPAFLQVTTSCHPLYPLSFLQIGCLKFYNNFLSISVLLLPAFLSSAFLLSACWLSCIICLLSFTLLSLPACFPSFCQCAFQLFLPSKLEQPASSSDCFFLPSASNVTPPVCLNNFPLRICLHAFLLSTCMPSF